MSAVALEIKDLNAWYGESHILHGIDLTVHKGEVVTLLGRNGAGRTTTLRAILGLTGARTGSVRIGGVEAIDMPTFKIAKLGLGYCPEERGIFASLSCEENLLLPPPVGALGGGMSLSEIYEMFPSLEILDSIDKDGNVVDDEEDEDDNSDNEDEYSIII
jgi:branched-chain amino acid transport system ATP-binding protein